MISNYHGFKPESEILLVVDPVDFRKSVDGLTAIIQLELQRDPMKPGCYVFCNNSMISPEGEVLSSLFIIW